MAFAAPPNGDAVAAGEVGRGTLLGGQQEKGNDDRILKPFGPDEWHGLASLYYCLYGQIFDQVLLVLMKTICGFLSERRANFGDPGSLLGIVDKRVLAKAAPNIEQVAHVIGLLAAFEEAQVAIEAFPKKLHPLDLITQGRLDRR
ncbi:hypothetical protein [Ensifer sp. 4252]|uniref:hypothetical protein n=1 Tax=Ensifer sp. 4252 TaxID=3373915 RepID=UPI003D1C1EB3